MNWNFFYHIGIISFSLLLAALLRARIRFFQRFLIPAPIISGIFLLVFYNFIAPRWGLKNDFLGEIVYHLLNISFISMLLRVTGKQKTDRKAKRTLAANVTAVMGQYGLQCFFGLVMTAIMIATFKPDLFPAFGFTLPLGFELGPGQAYSIGIGWEKMGFRGASSVGLTMAAIGFLIGSFGGVVLINQGLKRGWIGKEHAQRINNKSVRTGFFSRLDTERPVGSYLSTDGESLDSLSYHIALVMATYLISWGFLTGLTALLNLIGPLGSDLAESLWGINFIFSAFCALGVKMIMRFFKVETTIDNATCNRISGLSVDMTVASSLGAISLVTVQGYWLPILILTLTGMFITLVILPWYCSRIYDDHQFFRMLVIYGTGTGTLPTGLALLRVVDQEFETPVATDYLYSVGIVFILAIPIILSINLPAFSVTRNNPMLFTLAIIISGIYMLASFISYLLIAKKRAFAKAGDLFYTE
ncbi:sodium:glutamate symporter [Sphaerochaeta globosa]|uniref:Na+/glutamate symporter-like protein n=1 Tax=Sphaerochaeta globosa (strain ATCC BAA-1886 / DSM 22777 / Buddy) TaxID=158189 RepID=F0RUV2_SPHGB|nr:sodium:glutamate symporter [Sphaerochaeta globosa]ADY12530.1 Na+/glutamate symporter-like protein [Sphaerochaeta globosa str. Buddy]